MRLAQGENLYERPAVLEEPATKRPSYLPLFYLFVAATRWLGVREYGSWMHLWRSILVGTHLAIGGLIAVLAWRTGHPVIGLFGALFWGLSRWSLYVVRTGQIDELALLLLLASLGSFTTRRRTGLILFGASLAVKHIAVGVAPLYLIWTWQASRRDPRRTRVGEVIAAAGWMALIPLAVSLPFVWWNAGAFVDSLLLPTTREAGGHFNAAAVGPLAGLTGALAALPMLVLTLLVALAAARGEIGRYLSVVLVLAVFTDFNAVIFLQYLAWVVPFLALAAFDNPNLG